MRNPTKPVQEFSNEELLDEYSMYEHWLFDDYSLVQPEDEDWDRSEELGNEILRRMNGG